MEIVKLPDFVNVGASQSALIDRLPQGRNYDAIVLERGGTFTAAHVTQIQLKLGGKTVVDITGSHLDDLNEYYGHTTTSGYHFIWFADPKSTRTINGEMMGGIDTGNFQYSDFSLKVAIGAATSPTLKAWAIQSEPKGSPLFRAIIKGDHSAGAAGTFTQDVPLGSNEGALVRAVFFSGHSNITRVDVKKDGLYLQDEGTNALVQAIQNDANRVTQSGQIVWDACINNNQSNAVPTLKDNGKPATIEFRVTWSGSDTATSYTDAYVTASGL